MNYDSAFVALETHLHTLIQAQGWTAFWENGKFKPTEGHPYIRSFHLPAEPGQASIGQNGYDLVTGIFQVDLAEPKDVGTGDLSRKVDLVVAQFARGTYVTHNSQTLTVKRSWPGPSFKSENFHVVPVSVSWFTHS